MQYDDAVLQCFLENQEQLFPEGDVVSSLEEAEEFLEENFAVVVNSLREVWDFFEEVWTGPGLCCRMAKS